jgi:hypothetical protein
MAKTIKFNLICDEKPIRTIEDLQNNFSIEDILSYYENGLLIRWLDVRGYNKELEKVKAITEEEAISIIKKLIEIFEITIDSEEINKDVYILQYLKEKKELYSIYEKEEYKVKSIIDDYETGYTQLVDEILHNPNDVSKIKKNIIGIVDDYGWILKRDHRRLFYSLIDTSPLAVMCLLMNEKSRNYYLPVKVETLKTSETGSSSEYKVYDTASNRDKSVMYGAICSTIMSTNFINNLGDKLLKFSGVTDGYWKDLEPKGKKFMIINMGEGDYVRSAGVQGGDLSSLDVKDKFVIVDGIDYKSNSASRQLLYMEV